MGRVCRYLLWVVALVFQHGLYGYEAFGLRVDDVSGLAEPWPMIGGLPFAAGAVSDADQIRVVDERGAEVPAQIDTVAWWPDGSIRWAQAGITASPQGHYRVEYGQDVSRRAVAAPLVVEELPDGELRIDTGAAVFTFRPHGLLPDAVSVGGIAVLRDSAAGAYLVDNRGRMARVAGEAAEIENALLKQGPARVVIRREGWYVDGEGEQFARAKAWFYFAAGSPALRITHSLIFTRDTNELWPADYGLEFTTGQVADEVLFGFKEPSQLERFPAMAGGDPLERLTPEEFAELAELYSQGLWQGEREVFRVEPGGDEVYLLQEDYPHLLERDFQAVVGRIPAGRSGHKQDVFWNHDVLKERELSDDWGLARYADFSLAVVTPQLAQRFPKEIAVDADGIRVALWSGRSGRQLDFRAPSLVNDYYKKWAEYSLRPPNRGQAALEYLASQESNAMGAARTHDVWLIPGPAEVAEPLHLQRMAAASYPPLLQADPAWLAATGAIGYPIHPVDDVRFEREEAVLRDLWTGLMGGVFHNAGLRRSGFITWGANPNIAGFAKWFRISRLIDYNLRRGAWNLYIRSGNRSYYDYGARFNQFAGDWELGHWEVGDKYPGGFSSGTDNDLPFYWGSSSELGGTKPTGHTVMNWLLEYYLTGNEHSNELISMIVDAYRRHGEDETRRVLASNIAVLSPLYSHTGDEELRRLADSQVEQMVDLDNPTGLSDEHGAGVYYKTHRNLLALYDYYLATADERARQSFLQGVEDKYRYHLVFDRVGQPGSRGAFGRSFTSFLFAIGWKWTGREEWLRLLNRVNDEFREGSETIGLMTQMAPFMGVPTALAVLADAEDAIGPFPLLEHSGPCQLRLVKEEGHPLEMEIYIRTGDAIDEQAPPELVTSAPDGSQLDSTAFELVQMFQTRNEPRRNPRRWFIRAGIPASAAGGEYKITFPDAALVAILKSNAVELELSR